ncbi:MULTISPECIES: hypothetical protein [unclassified Curtobacterium]|uniref:hypothetical protein n=1 Tax=unclassified Curtobacterium TaxID=257496 RepID=UPI000DA9367B|nr:MULTISPECIES: hypothetical protein [unclassified Curtobacterium]PZE65916.1 hypothetical protein DEJ27_14160 [Curtobacterium sp. MCPF17_018]PZF31603.1 hypothetical protein DEJ35_06280 [Curtobacterium sp. MCPF17_051]
MSVAVAATIALGATGCEFMSPAHTADIKQITDGVDVSAGKVDVRNALLISDDGESARFIGTLVNNDDQDDYTVSIEVGGDTQTVDVPANTHVDLAMASGAGSDDESSVQEGDTTQGTTAGDAEPIVFDNADAKPGSLVKVYFSYPDAEGVSANVPVLTSSQEEYQTLAPSPTPTPTSTSPSESGAQSTGEAVPGTQPTDSQTDSSEGDNGTN